MYVLLFTKIPARTQSKLSWKSIQLHPSMSSVLNTDLLTDHYR